MTLFALTALSGAGLLPAFLLASKRRQRMTLRPLNEPILLPATQMVRLIQRECARIDRNGLSCALAVFSVPESKRTPTGKSLLLQTLHERARLTDVVGWLDDNTLGVFLTDATPDGAKTFADSVRQSLTDEFPTLQPGVHIYDGAWANLTNGAASDPVPALALSA